MYKKVISINSTIFYAPNVKLTDKMIYIYLCSLAEDNQIKVSTREIAARCGCAKQSVRNSVARLIKNKFLLTKKEYVRGKYSKGLTPTMTTYTILNPDFDYKDTQEYKFEQELVKGNLNTIQLKGKSK
jgi:predicted DNA-binding transcriptional regulator